MKKQYRALTGLEWDDSGLRIEAGDPLPDKVSQEEIKELLELGRIEEVE